MANNQNTFSLVMFSEQLYYIPDSSIDKETRSAFEFAAYIGSSEHECLYTKGQIITGHPDRLAKNQEEADRNWDLFNKASLSLEESGAFAKYKISNN